MYRVTVATRWASHVILCRDRSDRDESLSGLEAFQGRMGSMAPSPFAKTSREETAPSGKGVKEPLAAG